MRVFNKGLYQGVGIYDVAEAARLTNVSRARIRRWLRGYTYNHEGGHRNRPPVWARQLPEIDGYMALGFRDLLEVRFVDGFLRAGVSWKTLRLAAEQARKLFNDTHPFSTRRFETDGRSIFITVKNETSDDALIDIVKKQYAFKRILAPYLKGLEFDTKDRVLRWWPMGKSSKVVLDPRRNFGAPIVCEEGVPTSVLAATYAVEDSIEAVASWYDVSRRSVRDAIAYEKQLAA